MRWRLCIEEYSPDLHYIRGIKNLAADALSCLGILNNPLNEEHFTEALDSKLYAFDNEDLPGRAFPLSIAFIGNSQSTEDAILFKETAKTKSIQPFTGAGKTRELICYNCKMWYLRNYKQESSNATTITLDILVSINPKKPLVNTSDGQK
jgi:hypothetical protein